MSAAEVEAAASGPSWPASSLTAVAASALPWLFPFTSGPSPVVWPMLFSMACACLLAISAGVHRSAVAGAGAALVALVCAWSWRIHPQPGPELAYLAAALGVVILAAAASFGHAARQAISLGTLTAASLSAAMGLVQYAGWASAPVPWMNAAEAGQAYANLRQTNQYATLCWIGTAVVLWGPLPLARGVKVGLIALLATGCAASVSRTGLLQGAVLLVLAAVWAGPQRKERLALCGVAFATYAAASWLLPLLLEATAGALPARTLWRRLAGADGCSSRLVLWSNVLHLIAQKPLTGWGWGELDYAHYVTLYDRARFCEILDNAHNLPLHLAVEFGLPAALLACGGGLWWTWRQAPWAESMPLRQLAWALLALILLHSLLEYPLWYGPFQIAVGAALGWLVARRPESPSSRRLAPRAALAAISLVALGYASWDYARVSQIYLPPEARREAWREDTLEHARRSWLFQGQARFADVTLATPTRANAAWMYQEATRALHYSPEPRVIERVIESATFLGRDDEAVLHLARYRAAFPQDYEAWRQRQQAPAR